MSNPQWSPKRTELVNHVKQYARDHYEQDGWDILVECWSDEEIADELLLSMTNEQAVAYFKHFLKPAYDRRKDVEAEIF